MAQQETARHPLDGTAAGIVPVARDALIAAFENGWADPRRLHLEGRRAADLLEDARAELAAGLGILPARLSFLPSGPAALRAGLDGLLYAGRRRGREVVLSAVEHSALLLSVDDRATARSEPETAPRGRVVAVDSIGRIRPAAWRSCVQNDGVAAAALQHANAEVGTTQPLERAVADARASGVPVLVDATASLGRLPVPADWDVLVGDARSFGGPAGLGLLAVREGVRWRRPGPPGEYEAGRTDVEPVIPLATAAAAAWRDTESGRVHEADAAHRLIAAVRTAAGAIPGVLVLGDPDDRLPHVVTFTVPYLPGEAIVAEFDRRGFAVGSGSMCTSSALAPSHVLAAMGALTHGNVRITLPLEKARPQRELDIAEFLRELPQVVAKLRSHYDIEDL